MKILYIEASVRPDSRTKRLAKYILDRLDGEIKTLELSKENIKPLNNETLEFRTRLTEEQNYDNGIFHYAKEYSQADLIVISAPYWDLSFPAILKDYIEAINVIGITFKYSENGDVIGLCNAKRLVYITTSGGKIISDEYGYGYIKALAEKFHGIKEINHIEAEGLDIEGADIEEILLKAEKKADKIIKEIKENN